MSFNTLIDVASLLELLAAKDANLVLLDCRFDLSHPQAGRLAYLNGHIPGAQFADLNQDLSSPIGPQTGRHPLPGPRAFAARVRGWGIHRDSHVAVYDELNGSFAARAWWLLRWIGHPAVAVLDGGFKAWVAAGGPVATGEPTTPSRPSTTGGDADIQADADAVVNADQVAALLRDPRRLLVDARAAERFAGSVEPIDSVAGHVAGAVNRPFSQNLGPDGHFLPPQQLRQQWQSRLGNRAPSDVVAMCGSGVTACHNLLSLEIAGLRGAKLYAGSWSEWIRDPARPIARGAEPAA